MNRFLAACVAGAFALSPTFALADDETPSGYTQDVQTKLKKEADAKKAAADKMTPEEKAAAKKERDAKKLKDETTIEDRYQNPGDQRNMSINKSAETSKAGPTPPRGTINTPEAEKAMLKQKGQ